MMKFDLYESRTFGRICYGFGKDEKGYVYIKDDEAEVVRMIIVWPLTATACRIFRQNCIINQITI